MSYYCTWDFFKYKNKKASGHTVTGRTFSFLSVTEDNSVLYKWCYLKFAELQYQHVLKKCRYNAIYMSTTNGLTI